MYLTLRTLALPPEEYDWFDVQSRARQAMSKPSDPGAAKLDEFDELTLGAREPDVSGTSQRQFFDFAGPLFSVVISPAASTAPLNELRKFRALPRDRSRRRVLDDLVFAWEILEGEGSLRGVTDQEATFHAPAVPGLTKLRVTVTQRDVTVAAEALVTITDSEALFEERAKLRRAANWARGFFVDTVGRDAETIRKYQRHWEHE